MGLWADFLGVHVASYQMVGIQVSNHTQGGGGGCSAPHPTPRTMGRGVQSGGWGRGNCFSGVGGQF